MVMKGKKGQPSLQDLRDYYKRQHSRNILKKSCVFLKEKKQLTASGSQREDERPQNDRLGPTFVKEITTNHPNEPDLRSVHYRVIPLT